MGKNEAKAVVIRLSENWDKFDHLFVKYGAQYQVPWTHLKAIALNESSLGMAKSVARGLVAPSDVEGSKSSDGKSWGLMQLTLPTAQGFDRSATPEKLNNPEYSVKLAAQLLAQLRDTFSMFDGRYLEWVIKSYNQGPYHTKNEMKGQISNPSWHLHVEEYWNRFQRNLKKVGG